MSEDLKGPFSQIVRKHYTELTIVTTDPGQEEEEIDLEKEEFKDKFKATDVEYERGLAIKNTPDGESAQKILIWHPIWIHGKDFPRPPLIEKPSRQ